MESSVLIIGGGFAGIATALRLKQKYPRCNFHIYEKEASFGGTWWINRYPGCAVDIPAFFYSISSEPNKTWSRYFPPQQEILEYINGIVDKHDLQKHATFNCTVIGLDWDLDREEWVATIDCDGRTFTHRANVVVSGRGGLVNPTYPKIDGLELNGPKFKGVYAHSARWDPETSIKDKDIVVIGNGCSGAQIVPAVVGESKSVTQFFRAKHWYVPTPPINPAKARHRINDVFGVRFSRFLLFLYLESNFPMFTNEGRWANRVRRINTKISLDHMTKTAPEKYHNLLIPDFKIGCKRRIVDDGYLASLHNEKILLTDDPIVSVSEHHVHTKAGKSYHADIIFAATGFDILGSNSNIPIYGIDKDENLTEYWDRTGVSAYNVAQVPGYPNLFYLMGPNAGTGHNSAILQIENTLTYIEKVAGYVLNGQASSVDVKQEAYDKWKQEVREKSNQGIHLKGGCTSWYIRNGTNVTVYPWSQITYWWRAIWPKYADLTYHWNGKDVIQSKRRRRWVLILTLLTLLIKFKYFK